MPAKSYPIELLEVAVAALNQAYRDGYPVRAGGTRGKGARAIVAERLSMDPQKVTHILKRAREHGIHPDPSLYDPDARDSVSIDEHKYRLAGVEREKKSLRGQLTRSREKISALEEDLAEAHGISPGEPRRWNIEGRSKPRKGKIEHIPELLFSDFQYGEVIKREELDYPNEYNPAIAADRYRNLIETAIRLCEMRSHDWDFPGFVYVRGGDMISGDIHDELAETQDLTPAEQTEHVIELEIAGIERLLEVFDRLFVPSCFGNHGRTTKKNRAKRYSANNYEMLILAAIKRHFKDDKRLTFIDGKGFDVRYSIYGRPILATHGDNIGSRGGQGFVGPSATVARGIQKVIQERQRAGEYIEAMRIFHFHTALDLGYGLVNGAPPGYSEYAKSNRLSPEPASQWLLFHHRRHGLIGQHKIYLSERPDPPPNAFIDIT